MTSYQPLYGYFHPTYAQSFKAFGQPRYLSESGAWILQRRISQEQSLYDAMGLYPLLCCLDWSGLGQDLTMLQDEGVIAFSIVTDPFGNYDKALLRANFRDVLYPYKAHFVVDLQQLPRAFVSSHHQRNVKQASKQMSITICDDPLVWLDDWVGLYDNLIERHQITGITAFSRESFEHQLQVPGLTMFRAARDSQTLGMTLWYTHHNVSYYHLGAYSEFGYELGASFALFWHSIEHFANLGLQWLNLGGGTQTDGTDGLSRFKRGWSNETRMTYFGGRILDLKRYNELSKHVKTNYFPAYRSGEFG